MQSRASGGTIKLNLGCGFDKREGWLNVDNFAKCEPDKLLDIEATPWDLPTDGFSHVLLRHVLEHVGADFETFKRVMQKLYRITAPNGLVEIHVPHVRHDNYWSDPTHVRVFLPKTFEMLSKRRNRDWMARRVNSTTLAFVLDVDFEVDGMEQVYDPIWWAKVESGELTREACGRRRPSPGAWFRSCRCGSAPSSRPRTATAVFAGFPRRGWPSRAGGAWTHRERDRDCG